MELTTLKIEKPEAINFILGQTHFIKSVEDTHEALVTAVPDAHFTDALEYFVRQKGDVPCQR